MCVDKLLHRLQDLNATDTSRPLVYLSWQLDMQFERRFAAKVKRLTSLQKRVVLRPCAIKCNLTSPLLSGCWVVVIFVRGSAALRVLWISQARELAMTAQISDVLTQGLNKQARFPPCKSLPSLRK